MMRTVWAAVVSVWALFAVVAVLAWTRQPNASPAPSPAAVVIKGPGGKNQVVLVQSGASGSAHATTRTSPVAAG
jgi:cyanate permease